MWKVFVKSKLISNALCPVYQMHAGTDAYIIDARSAGTNAVTTPDNIHKGPSCLEIT